MVQKKSKCIIPFDVAKYLPCHTLLAFLALAKPWTLAAAACINPVVSSLSLSSLVCVYTFWPLHWRHNWRLFVFDQQEHTGPSAAQHCHPSQATAFNVRHARSFVHRSSLLGNTQFAEFSIFSLKFSAFFKFSSAAAGSWLFALASYKQTANASRYSPLYSVLIKTASIFFVQFLFSMHEYF